MGPQSEALGQIAARNVLSSALEPNPWNPNVMDPEMFAKEVESIREFGFVDPLTVRELESDRFQIIDGEHRWKAGISLGMEAFPCIVVLADDETAKQLTIVLNETRGTADAIKMSKLVQELAEKRDQAQLARVLPFTTEKLRSMITDTDPIDWDALRDRRDKMKKDRDRWVEKVYRMPVDAAKVIDDAVEKVKSEEGVEQEWRALELIAADALASR